MESLKSLSSSHEAEVKRLNEELETLTSTLYRKEIEIRNTFSQLDASKKETEVAMQQVGRRRD